MKDFLIDFGIPVILIVGSFILISLGIDGEMKSILTISGLSRKARTRRARMFFWWPLRKRWLTTM